MALKTLPEHRKAARVNLQGPVEIELTFPRDAHQPSNLHPLPIRLAASSVNLSEGGICVRMEEPLEIRAQVTLRLFAQTAAKKPLECSGRIAWVVQRLDLKDSPPFLYDVGVEFVDATNRLRQLMSRAGVLVKPASEHLPQRVLEPALLNGHRYVPRLERESSPSPCWHLTVWVEGVPCFSQRHPSSQEAADSWEQFKRQAAQGAPRPSRHR